MRLTQLPLTTFKETPADAEIASHRLMLRAGMIRKLAAGIYTWLPLGLRVLRKVENIVREEMNRAGALEMLMPCVQPAELWRETGRWDVFGPLLLRFTDQGKREFCFGPTHEEVITDIARRDLKSYKQLPVIYYQIQTKFRDEIRPRFGVMRAREFIMKDAYSFNVDDESLEESYAIMHDAYCRIFDRLGLRYRAVQADSGAIGGAVSHEFQVLADAGEDRIAYSEASDYAANVELAEAVAPRDNAQPSGGAMRQVATPGTRTIEAVTQFLDLPASRCIKTILVKAHEDAEADAVALLLRGDHEINMVKAEKLPDVAVPIELADATTVRRVAGCDAGFIGPVGLDCPMYADHSALASADFACGANAADAHLVDVNWERDLPRPQAADLRNVTAGDLSPDGSGPLSIARGIEVGHIFQLGRKYADAMDATVLNNQGKKTTMTMGCYGIGVSRIVAAAIEQHHDEQGIVWPGTIAPFEVVLIPLNLHKSERVRAAADKLYAELAAAGVDVVLDDRDARPGFKFADSELLGIPHRLVLNDRGLDAGTIEYKSRTGTEKEDLPLADIVQTMLARRATA